MSVTSFVQNYTFLSVLEVRMAGIKGKRTGAIQVQYKGDWRYVCSLGSGGAAVACRKMGFKSGIDHRQYAADNGTLNIGRIVCSGKERDILDCTLTNLDGVPCPNSYISGATCTNKGKVTGMNPVASMSRMGFFIHRRNFNGFA